MVKPMIYKEWIKTRWCILLATLVSLCYTGYIILRFDRVIEIMGPEHLWQVMLEKDVVFVDIQMYIPLIIGLALAVVQYVPEMLQSRLKLTLHLPHNHYAIVGTMLLYGIVSLLLCFAVNFVILWIYLADVLAVELVRHVLLSSVTWYVAGFAAYIFTAWICLEPTWKRRIINIIISVCILSIFFLSPVPESYNDFIIVLTVYTVLTLLFPMLSVHRFKTGYLD